MHVLFNYCTGPQRMFRTVGSGCMFRGSLNPGESNRLCFIVFLMPLAVTTLVQHYSQ